MPTESHLSLYREILISACRYHALYCCKMLPAVTELLLRSENEKHFLEERKRKKDICNEYVLIDCISLLFDKLLSLTVATPVPCSGEEPSVWVQAVLGLPYENWSIRSMSCPSSVPQRSGRLPREMRLLLLRSTARRTGWPSTGNGVRVPLPGSFGRLSRVSKHPCEFPGDLLQS